MIINGSCQDERIKLIWENPDATAPFEAQTIDVDPKRPFLYIVSKFYSSESTPDYFVNVILNDVDVGEQMIEAFRQDSTVNRSVRRKDEGLYVGYGRRTLLGNSPSTGSNSYVAVPYRIYESY